MEAEAEVEAEVIKGELVGAAPVGGTAGAAAVVEMRIAATPESTRRVIAASE